MKTETSQKNKEMLMVEKRIHRLKYKAFYDLLKEKREDLITISFDCQKNFAYPRVPDQIVYYKKQFYLYNYCIVKGSSKDPLKDNVYAYTWGEHDFNKGANEIASAVFHFLKNSDLTGVTTLRCIADGCGGQNKNTVFMSMLSYWFCYNAPKQIKVIEVIFPIVGHSFLPPDRVFATIEKEIKCKEILVDPKDYYEVLEKYAKVTYLGKDCEVYDWKENFTGIVKPPSQWHFKFAPTKRFIFTKSKTGELKIQGEVAYKTNVGVPKGVLKKGKKLSMANLKIVRQGKKIREDKITDVKIILKNIMGTTGAV